MRNPATPKAVDELVLRQATAIVGKAVRDALVTALRAAEACGCRSCRAAAPRTFLWASAMLPTDGEVERSSRKASAP